MTGAAATGSHDTRQAAFVRRHARLAHAPLVPEIALHLARDPLAIFEAAAGDLGVAPELPPYWAFAWPGGQAAARYLLDRPEAVAGRSLLDLGAGSGIAAIAGARAGARAVLAADIDPLACSAIALNAAANGVGLATTIADVLGVAPDHDLVVIGDLVYEPELAQRVTAYLEAAAARGTAVLLADRISARRPPLAFELVATYDAPLTPALPAHPFEKARLWWLTGRRRKPTRR